MLNIALEENCACDFLPWIDPEASRFNARTFCSASLTPVVSTEVQALRVTRLSPSPGNLRMPSHDEESEVIT